MLIFFQLADWAPARDRSRDIDSKKARELLESRYPDTVRVGTEDDLAAELEGAIRFFGDPDNPVVSSLRRKSESYGPAINCELTGIDGTKTKCRMRAVDISFRTDGEFSTPELRDFAEFLRPFGEGPIRVAHSDRKLYLFQDYLERFRPGE